MSQLCSTPRTYGWNFASQIDLNGRNLSERPSSVPAQRNGSCSPTFSRIEMFGNSVMTDARDIQHGVNDPVSGVDVKRKFNDNQTPHERAQRAADVRADSLPAADEEFLPEALRRRPTEPLNKRTGRNPTR
jgi:hypothetical protein